MFDNLSEGDAFIDPRTTVKIGDIRNFAELHAYSVEHEFSAVVHLAGQTGVPLSVEHPMEDFEANAAGTIHVLEVARLARIPTVITVSSNAAVGLAPPPTSEESVPRPVTPYGAHKLYLEAITRAYAHSYHMNTGSVRLANVYGPLSTHKSSVIANWFRCIRSGERVVVFGNGSATRDFIHVTDVARVIARLLEADLGGEVVCVGTGVETSVLTLVDIVREVVGRAFGVEMRPARPGEVARNFANVRQLEGLLPEGFTFTDLRVGLAETWKWYLQH